MPRLRPALDARKERHAALNEYIGQRGRWLTSIAGSTTMRFEARHGSALPDDLRGKGYIVTPAGSTTRIDPHATATITLTEIYELALTPGALP